MIPEELRDDIRSLINLLEDGTVQWLLENGLIDDDERDSYQASFERVRAWLKEQPQAPEPDWSQAPSWAMWWACNASGTAKWFGSEPEYAVDRDYGDWVSTYRLTRDDAFYRISLGIDWRTLKVKRPEVQP